MIAELRKSFSAILFERITSPLYGTLLLTWLIWNWKIVYITAFISEDAIEGNKIDYITTNYSSIWTILLLPIFSTIFLLTVMPFVVNGAFWLSQNFRKWRYDKKLKIDKAKLLTLEQSIEIRNAIAEQEERFKKQIEAKEGRIMILLEQISELANEKQVLKDKNKELSKLEGKEKGIRNYKFKNQTPPDGYDFLDDDYYDEIIDLQEYKIEMTVTPTSHIEHWRCGVKFSTSTKFVEREKRHIEGYPIFHLEKNAGEKELRWSYYNEENKNIDNKPIVPDYKEKPVILSIALSGNGAVLDVLDENRKSILSKLFVVKDCRYCQLFAWGDSRNEFEIDAVIEKTMIG